MAALVAYRWAGAANEAKRDRWTNQQTNQQTERVVESRARD